MNTTGSKRKTLITIRWLVRGLVGLFTGFMIFMVAGYAIQDGYLIPADSDAVAFLFAPIGYTVGLIIALKWEGVGGSVIIASALGWHISMGIFQGDPQLGSAIDLFAVPGVIFLLLWFAFRDLSRPGHEWQSSGIDKDK